MSLGLMLNYNTIFIWENPLGQVRFRVVTALARSHSIFGKFSQTHVLSNHTASCGKSVLILVLTPLEKKQMTRLKGAFVSTFLVMLGEKATNLQYYFIFTNREARSFDQWQCKKELDALGGFYYPLELLWEVSMSLEEGG